MRSPILKVVNFLALPVLIAGFTSQASIIVAVGAQNAFIIRQGIMRSHIPQIIAICIGADVLLIGLGTEGMSSIVTAHPIALKALTWVGAAVLFSYGVMAFGRVWRRLRDILPAWCMRVAPRIAATVGGFGNTAALAGGRLTVGKPVARRAGAPMMPAASAEGTVPAHSDLASPSSSRQFSPQQRSAERPSLKKAVLLCLGFTFLNPGVYLDTLVLLGGIAATYGETLKWSFALGAMMCSVVWFMLLGVLSSQMSRLFNSNRAWLVLDTIIGFMMVLLSIHLVLR